MSTEEISYGARLTQLADERGEVAALTFVRVDGTEEDITYRQLEDRANQIAHLLGDRVGQDDVVAVVLPNSIEHVVTTLATWKLGGTVMPLRADLPRWELDKLLDLAGPAAVVAEERVGDSGVSLDDIRASTDRPVESLPDRIPECTQLVASSGSTGTPKLIVAPARGVLAGDAQAGLLTTSGDQVTLVVSPLYHVNGFAFTAPRLLEGSRVVLMERFDASLAADLIERHQVTYTVMVPTMLQRIAQLPDIRPDRLTSLERVVYGGATIPDWVVDRWIELIPPERFMFAYGSSERLAMCAMTGAEWEAHRGATGRPMDADMRILDPDGNEVATGEVGDVYFRPYEGRPLFRYLGHPMPEATDDGYRTVGDVGSVDADGFLTIVDRRHDMIVTGGANVFPAEVENALSEHGGLVDQVVVGVEDSEWGHRVHAIIQAHDPSAVPSADELRSHCKARLASYKVPKSFEVVSELPRTAAGKVNRTRLAETRR